METPLKGSQTLLKPPSSANKKPGTSKSTASSPLSKGSQILIGSSSDISKKVIKTTVVSSQPVSLGKGTSIPLLSSLCLDSMVSKFKEFPRAGIPAKYSDSVYSRISLDMPLTQTIQLFGKLDDKGCELASSATYWKRLCHYVFPKYKCDRRQHGDMWISTFFEVLVENFAENNNMNDEAAAKLNEILTIAGPYVRRLNIKYSLPDEWYSVEGRDKISIAMPTSKPLEKIIETLKPIQITNKLQVKWEDSVKPNPGPNGVLPRNTPIAEGQKRNHSIFRALLTNLPNLRHISYNSTQMKDLQLGYRRELFGLSEDDTDSFSYAISQSKLQSLDLHGNGITDILLIPLIDGIQKCKTLESVNLSYNEIENKGLAAVTSYLSQPQLCTNLKELKLRGNKFTDINELISTVTTKNTTLKSLDISFNAQVPIEDYVKLFDDLASSNLTLQELSVSSCDLDDSITRSIVNLLQKQAESNYHILEQQRSNKTNNTDSVSKTKEINGKPYTSFPSGLLKLDLSANSRFSNASGDAVAAQVDCMPHYINKIELRGTLVSADIRERIVKILKGHAAILASRR